MFILVFISLFPVIALFFDGYSKGKLKTGIQYILSFLLFLTTIGFTLFFFKIYSIFIFPLELVCFVTIKYLESKKNRN